MSLDRIWVEGKRSLHFALGGSQILLSKRETSQCQMKAGFIVFVEAAEPLFGFVELSLIARRFGQKKHRFIWAGDRSRIARASFLASENCPTDIRTKANFVRASRLSGAKSRAFSVLRADPRNAIAIGRLGTIWFEQGAPLNAAFKYSIFAFS